jgi:hypothetical protein
LNLVLLCEFVWFIRRSRVERFEFGDTCSADSFVTLASQQKVFAGTGRPWCTISRTPRFDLTLHIDKSLSCRLAWPPYKSRTAYPCDSWRKEGPGREHGISGKGSTILSEIQGGDDQEQGSGQELPSLKVLKGEVVASLATKSNRGWAKGLLPGPTPSLLLLPRLQRLDGQIAF